MATAAYPPGGTIIDSFKKSFVDVPIDAEKDNAISTAEFLDAAESLTTMFDALGSVAFSPVKKDILGNVKASLTPTSGFFSLSTDSLLTSFLASSQKIRERFLASPVDSATLQSLCKAELASKQHTATEGLVWLNRGLEFTCIALSQNLANANEELSESFRGAYGVTLKPHHSFMVKPIFSAAMSAVPYRKDFYLKLGDDPEKVAEVLKVYLAALDKIVAIIKGFLSLKEYKW